MMYRLAIIGGGLTATSMVCQLVDGMKDIRERGQSGHQSVSVDVFEKQSEIGPGMPHNARFVMPCHITNMCAEDMTVRVSRPGDFQTWVNKNSGSIEEIYAEQPGLMTGIDAVHPPCHHYPRAIMGEYLKGCMEDACSLADAIGVTLSLYAGSEVVDLAESAGEFYLTVKNRSGEKSHFGPYDGALLATGHWTEPSHRDNYFSSPWPADDLLEKIPPGSTVGVLGSSLSAIEVALTLSSDGRFRKQTDGTLSYQPSENSRKISLYSRRGLLPKVRGRIGLRTNRYLSCERLRAEIAANPCAVRLSTLFDLLNRELVEAYGHPIDWQQVVKPTASASACLEDDLKRAQSGDGPDGELVWQTVLVSIFPVIRELFLNLDPADRARFEDEFNTLFFLHAATQPVINAEKIRALIRAGIVSVIRLGEGYRLSSRTGPDTFELVYGQQEGSYCRDIFSYCVDARGQRRSVASDASELIQNLLRKGFVEPENLHRGKSGTLPGQAGSHTGSIIIDPATHRVLRSDSLSPGNGSARDAGFDLFAVGAMTRSQIIDASMANGLARSTAAITRQLIEKLGH